jgi:hypothetical protein
MISKREILEEAIAAVVVRGKSYGSLEENFSRIARLWNQHLVNIGLLDSAPRGLGCSDVALMMALVKIARLENDPGHHDSWVDLAGYAACGGELANSTQPRTGHATGEAA